MERETLSRRGWLKQTMGMTLLPEIARAGGAERVKITGMEVLPVPVNARGNWIFVRLKAGDSLTGLGEASHGARVGRSQEDNTARMRQALAELFLLVDGRSPFEVEAFRMKAWPRAKAGGLLMATACSALEQAQWDLAGKALGVPVYDLLGGKVRNTLEIYANINRATNRRTPEEFAENAAKAVAEGFRAIKAAPFDDFPRLDSPPAELERMANLSIRRIEAMRKAIGSEIALLIDCHSHFNRQLSIEIGHRLEPFSLYWYEEPVPPAQLEDTSAIKKAVKQKMAGGEILFGREEFEPLCRSQSLDVIMPDVKHCGGILEGKKIAAIAEVYAVQISPHNPSGPVATSASAQLCAGLSNFVILEYAWGEVSWRRDLVDPPEQFVAGKMPLPDRPGIGIELNEAIVNKLRA